MGEWASSFVEHILALLTPQVGLAELCLFPTLPVVKLLPHCGWVGRRVIHLQFWLLQRARFMHVSWVWANWFLLGYHGRGTRYESRCADLNCSLLSSCLALVSILTEEVPRETILGGIDVYLFDLILIVLGFFVESSKWLWVQLQSCVLFSAGLSSLQSGQFA